MNELNNIKKDLLNMRYFPKFHQLKLDGNASYWLTSFRIFFIKECATNLSAFSIIISEELSP